jgi:hypothetical protein
MILLAPRSFQLIGDENTPTRELPDRKAPVQKLFFSMTDNNRFPPQGIKQPSFSPIPSQNKRLIPIIASWLGEKHPLAHISLSIKLPTAKVTKTNLFENPQKRGVINHEPCPCPIALFLAGGL